MLKIQPPNMSPSGFASLGMATIRMAGVFIKISSSCKN
jgi:hypothetical protein